MGDVRRARSLVERAKSLGVATDPIDNPEKLDHTISRYADLMAQCAARGNTESWRQEHARILMEEADALLRYRDYDEAERLATEAQRQGVRFNQFEPRPELLLQHIDDLRRREQMAGRAPHGVTAAEYVAPAGGAGESDRRFANVPAVYDPANDPTRNIPVGNDQPPPAGSPAGMAGQPSPGLALFSQGQAALRAGDRDAALELFRQAYVRVNELDPTTARRLHDYLQNLPPTMNPPRRPFAGGPGDEAQARQQALYQQIAADVAMQESQARRMLASDPKGALALLGQVRTKVEQSELEKPRKDVILRRIDRAAADTKKFITAHLPQIELNDRNQATMKDLQHDRQAQQEIEMKFAQKVDEFRTLVHEQRFAEAEIVAKQAGQLKPDDPVSMLLLEEVKTLRRVAENKDIKERQEHGFLDTLASVDRAAIPFSDETPIVYPDMKTWSSMTARRSKLAKEMGRHGEEKEIEIRQKLKTPVSLQFDNAPLSQVLAYMSKIAGINIYPDPQGLAEEGVTTDTPVVISLPQEVKLESALNLILHPLRLSYVVKDEVLKITSEQHREGDLIARTYNVADLVIPIPNFQPGAMGMQSAYNDAMGRANSGTNALLNPLGTSTNGPMAVVATKDGRSASGMIDSEHPRADEVRQPLVLEHARGNQPDRNRGRRRSEHGGLREPHRAHHQHGSTHHLG